MLFRSVKVEAVNVEAVKVEAVKVEAVRKDRARATFDVVLEKVSPSCAGLKLMLGNNDPALYKTLGFK